uniref:Uncharacterized protein n=1 Tax=Arundo donax TaxID=35708 RepID=A0A0A9G082_ARUDO
MLAIQIGQQPLKQMLCCIKKILKMLFDSEPGGYMYSLFDFAISY